MGKPLRVLIVEDSADDTQLVLRELRRSGYEVAFERVETAEAMQAALEHGTWDLILSDYSMPAFGALQALERLKASGLDLPFILISGTIGEESAITALKAGANDFLVKGKFSRLGPAIERELREADSRRERKRAEAALQNSEELFRTAFHNSPAGMCMTTVDGRLQTVNQPMADMLGFTRAELEGKHFNDITHPQDLVIGSNFFEQMVSGRVLSVSFEKRYRHKSGETIWAHVSSTLLRDSTGRPLHFITHILNITERKQAEEALRLSEKQYRSLFEDSPFSLWVEDFSEVKQRLDELKGQGIDDFPAYLRAHPEFIMECSRSIKILDVNAAALKLYHAKEKSELLGRLTDVLPATPPAELANELIHLANGRLNFERESVDQTLTGEEIYVNLRWSVAPGYEDNLAKVIVSTVDLTERKRDEEKIERQLNRLNALRDIDAAISSSFDVGVTLDIVLKQAISQLHVDAAAILLYQPHTQSLEYAGSRGFRFNVPPHGKIKLGQGYAGRAALERHTIHLLDLRGRSNELANTLQSANEGFVEYYATPLMVKSAVNGVLEIYHRTSLRPDNDWMDFLETLAGQAAIAIDNAQLFDRLQRVNAELEQRVAERTAELNQLNIELQHANRAKDEFLANMSHELRTPLNSILGLSESLLEGTRGPLNDHQQKSLQTVQSSGRHLLELINDILDLSKIEAGKFDYYPQIIEVDALCRASLAFIREQAARKSVNLNYAENTAVARMNADPRRLKQILVNLLTNAVKFTPEGGQVTLQVNVDAEQDLIQFAVIDTGVGIAPEDLGKLFQPFVQVDSSLTRQFEGTGLGLALVQKLADLHGGSVQVESEPDQGSRFTVNLPWGQNTMGLTGVTRSQGALRNNEQTERDSAPAQELSKRRTILIAEDNAANILTIGDYLESHGYEIFVAQDGLEAVEKTEAINPDIILMDIQMPSLDGLEATRLLRTNPRFASTPIIALTALAMPGDRERCLEAGANEYMSKPVSLKTLVETIGKLLNDKEQ